MLNNISRIVLLSVLPIAIHAQTVEKKPLTFEAASVKPAVVPGGVTISGNSMTASRREDFQRLRNTGGPGTNDPGRIHYPLVSLKGLLTRAFVSYFEIKGPGFLDNEVVQVDATMPPNTTKEQFQEMLANLIIDRFKLKYHVETKEVSGYSLVVAKGGVKIKESVESPAPQERTDDPQPPGPRPRVMGPDGFPIPPAGPTFMLASSGGGRMRVFSRQQAIEPLVRNIESMLQCRIADDTGLKAKYDYTLTFTGGFGPSGPVASPLEAAVSEPSGLPDIFSALQSQLGLKLEPKKVPVEIFVVDHMEKAPAEN
jgi:uncharacterized protein (TIGR03435 family)